MRFDDALASFDRAIAARPDSGMSQLDRNRFKIFGYHVGRQQDQETEVAAKLCFRFVRGPLSLEAWRKEILADAPHVYKYLAV